MTQLRQIEIGVEGSQIKPGDIVRLQKPFRPERLGSQEYAFAIVAGVVTDDFSKSQFPQALSDSEQTVQGHQSGWNGLVVHLYEPDSSTIYVDKFGVEALFCFDSHEVELQSGFFTQSVHSKGVAYSSGWFSNGGVGSEE